MRQGLKNQCGVCPGEGGSAYILRHVNSSETKRRRFPHYLHREDRFFVSLGGVGRELIFGEAAGGVLERRLVIGEIKIHRRCSPGRAA